MLNLKSSQAKILSSRGTGNTLCQIFFDLGKKFIKCSSYENLSNFGFDQKVTEFILERKLIYFDIEKN